MKRGSLGRSNCYTRTLRTHHATRRRSKPGRGGALVLDLARDACDSSAGGRTGVVPVRLVRQFETGGHRGGVLLVYVNLKSKPYGKVECITAKHERIPAVHDRAVGEVQADGAFATDHFQSHSADRALLALAASGRLPEYLPRAVLAVLSGRQPSHCPSSSFVRLGQCVPGAARSAIN